MRGISRSGPTTGWILLTVFAPFTAAYLISELYRNINGVIAPELRQTVAIGPEKLGLLSSVFLIAIAVAQIPVGVLLDRYGSRRVVALMMGLAVVGSCLFTIPAYPAMVLGRFMLGLGLGACWAGAYRANVLWWSREHLPMINGALLGVSGLGALIATRPTEIALRVCTWQTLFLVLALATLGIAITLWFLMPADPAEETGSKTTLAGTARGLLAVATHPLFLRMAPVTFMCEGTWLAYQGLWGGVWLRQVSGLDASGAADVLFVFALAIVIGQLALSGLTGRLMRRGIALETVMIVMIGAFVATQAGILWAPTFYPGFVWGVLGLLTAGPILSYAWLTTELPQHWAGRIISLLNLCATFAGFALQYAVGWFLQTGFAAFGGAGHVSSQRWAFGLLTAGQLAGLIWFKASCRVLPSTYGRSRGQDSARNVQAEIHNTR